MFRDLSAPAKLAARRLPQPLQDVIADAQRIRHDRQRRTDGAARREEGAVNDAQIVEIEAFLYAPSFTSVGPEPCRSVSAAYLAARCRRDPAPVASAPPRWAVGALTADQRCVDIAGASVLRHVGDEDRGAHDARLAHRPVRARRAAVRIDDVALEARVTSERRCSAPRYRWRLAAPAPPRARRAGTVWAVAPHRARWPRAHPTACLEGNPRAGSTFGETQRLGEIRHQTG